MKQNIEAIHDLICSTLRGPHIRSMDLEGLRSYVLNLGAVLHTIPSVIDEAGEIPLSSLLELNQLDPTGSEHSWGEWCVQLCETLNQNYPQTPVK